MYCIICIPFVKGEAGAAKAYAAAEKVLPGKRTTPAGKRTTHCWVFSALSLFCQQTAEKSSPGMMVPSGLLLESKRTMMFVRIRIPYFLLTLFTVWPLLLSSPLTASPAYIKGRVFSQAGPLAGARIHIFKSYDDIGQDSPFFTSKPTDGQGLYTFQLDPGEYYFTAKGRADGQSYFAYHGGNPIRIGSENIWISFMTNAETEPVYTDGATAIEGTVTYKGKPVQGAHVAIYTLDARKFKGLGFLSDKGIGFMKAVRDDGTFRFSLPPNKYVVIARKIQDGSEIRPLRSGDLFCYATANPIAITEQKIVHTEVPCYPKQDRLTFVDSPRIKTNDYSTLRRAAGGNEYGIKGKVLDGEGRSLSGLYVVAYRTDHSADPISEAENIDRTDAQGNFFIPLDSAGQYGLIVRETLGGAPRFNEISGMYNEEEPWKGIDVTSGKIIEDVNIYIKGEKMRLFFE